MYISETLKRVFSKYVPSSNSLRLAKGGSERMLICFSIELRNFEQFDFDEDLRELAALMQYYYSLVSERMLAGYGDVNGFWGKRIICFWEVGKIDYRDIWRCIQETYESLQDIPSFQRIAPSWGGGICSGRVIHDFFGGERRLVASAFGQPVNCAVKLAGLREGLSVCESFSKNIPPGMISDSALQSGEHSG